MGVDSTTVLDPNGAGRQSVRISTQKSWNHGLFIADINHMPGGVCGIWPACKLCFGIVGWEVVSRRGTEEGNRWKRLLIKRYSMDVRT